mgnify:FL=1
MFYRKNSDSEVPKILAAGTARWAGPMGSVDQSRWTKGRVSVLASKAQSSETNEWLCTGTCSA